jgi:hypothetical protein
LKIFVLVAVVPPLRIRTPAQAPASPSNAADGQGRLNEVPTATWTSADDRSRKA